MGHGHWVPLCLRSEAFAAHMTADFEEAGAKSRNKAYKIPMTSSARMRYPIATVPFLFKVASSNDCSPSSFRHRSTPYSSRSEGNVTNDGNLQSSITCTKFRLCTYKIAQHRVFLSHMCTQ